MTTLREKILARAETTFDHHGFAGSGVDRLTAAAEVSSRTLYKHVTNKQALVVAVLEERQNRFFARFDVDDLEALFEELAQWAEAEGARGCLFLRAAGEMGEDDPAVAAAVARYRERLLALIERLCAKALGQAPPTELTEQVLVLFEGAVSASSYRGESAIRAAGMAALLLIGNARAER
ncbi:TetR/AcrR family transcriptional regulator [Martelella endophytica]|uniref:TetR family transcriptional regulator n=1 Tax=Martelella endophytica TaxID=1486262 RepID=A0A0D5LSE0_MAREN|nr:TetR/AcrR family transcriptional regulator [Martelella endophytica]AJY47124.1 TetR family transcriptional regulator [Martelella endophytica]